MKNVLATTLLTALVTVELAEVPENNIAPANTHLQSGKADRALALGLTI